MVKSDPLDYPVLAGGPKPPSTEADCPLHSPSYVESRVPVSGTPDRAYEVQIGYTRIATEGQGTRMANTATQALTQLEFEGKDFKKAERIAASLGYTQFAYTSTSALWGMFCMRDNPEYAKPGAAKHNGCIIKTRELGFLFVQDLEDLRMTKDYGVKL
jgi:hypothetical protein